MEIVKECDWKNTWHFCFVELYRIELNVKRFYGFKVLCFQQLFDSCTTAAVKYL